MKSKTRRYKILGSILALLILLGIGGGIAFENMEKRGIEPKQMFPFLPIPGGEGREESEALSRLEQQWNDRLTYPTGRFNPAWLRQAAAQDQHIPRGIPAGRRRPPNAKQNNVQSADSLLSLNTNSFISLGPQPLRMTGCSGCFNYTTTEGRINVIVVDPTTTTSGSIVAYAGSVGGGVWKTTNCCSSSTTWTVVTDDPLIGSISIDTLAIDPNNHNTVYAGTGDLNYGSFSMGSQGILKSTDAGAHWTVLGANVFGLAYTEPAGQFPQYDAVGKVRVDPNNSNNVVAGTKKGLFFSYDAGINWTGPCTTNSFSSQRQDITSLELTNIGGSTRIIAAVGVRGFASTVQYDLGNNGANGLYRATMAASGCPTFTSIASNTNGFVFGTSVSGSPYSTGANMNAGSGSAYVSVSSGDQLGRIDIAVAPSNPNVIYAQAQSIAANNNSQCGNTNGCQIGVWVTTNGGTSWSFMAGSAGGSLRDCSNASGDYPQNWYDQALAVDPNNADRVFISTFDVWFATRTGTSFNDTTCGYSYSGSAGPVHVDQHAIAFVPGSSSIMLIGNDGGIHGTSNASAATSTTDPTWFNMDTGLNTIEFYSGDISGNFANSSAPQANGGAQDNGSMSVTFSGSPTGPVQWQMGRGGDGFYARIDPVGTGTSLRFWQGNNSGSLGRCISNCTASGATWTTKTGGWTGDTQSFILPYDLFHGGVPGGDDCAAAASNGGCGNLVAGTTRVWETITGNAANTTGTVTWYVTNSPSTQNMTKQTLGNRSFINQVKYSPKYKSVAMVGTNDGNVWIGRNLGTGTAGQALWTNVTGGNAVLPNRPVLGIALDPTVAAANVPVGYAAVGGFNANTPSTPGHVFRVICAANCASFTWSDKTGNLPDIPVDSIIVNPNFPQQVFAGTDFGLYYTDDITEASPTWNHFQAGLPNVMIWDMQIDRGSTTLSVWTRSRGAYVWPLTLGPINPLTSTLTVASASGPYGGTVNLSATLKHNDTLISGKTVNFSLNGNSVGSATTNGSGVAALNNVSLAGLNAGSYPGGISASFAGDSSYASSSGTADLTVTKANQTITFGPLANKTYGDPDFDVSATSSSGLAVSFSANGNCTISVSTVHITGAGSCIVTASQAGDTNYNAAPDVPRTFSIAKATATVTLSDLSYTYDGSPKSATVTTDPSGLSYSVTYNGSATSPTNAGDYIVLATVNDANYQGTATDTLHIAKADQTITILTHAPASAVYNTQFAVDASASSGLPVSFSGTGGCTNAGSTFTMTSGTTACTVNYDQAGNVNYNAAPQLTESVSAIKADQTITFAALADKTYGDPDFAPGATASSGLAISYSAAGNCSIVGGNVHISGAGSCTVTASQPGNDNYNAAEDVLQSFNIAKASQTITFPAIADKVYGAADFDPGATASSGLPVSYSALANCSIVSGNVHLTGAGICTVTASQAGDANYDPALDVVRSFNISPAPTSLAFSVTPSSVQYSDPTTLQAALTPFNISGDLLTGSVEFFVNGSSVGSVAPNSSGIATLVLTVTSAPGSYSVTAQFTSTNPNFTNSSNGPVTLTVTQEDARTNYNGNSLFWTASVNDNNANVTLSATVRDITAVTGDSAYDEYAGDIRNAKVTFVNRDTNTPLSGCVNLSIGLVSAGDTKTGTATCSTNLSLGNNNSSGGTQYTIGMIVSGYYTRNSAMEDSIITIAQPIPSNFITGGGHLVLSNSSGLVPGDVGSNTNFGFNVKFNKKGTSLQGNINILVRSGGHVYKIKGNAIVSLGVVNNQANFTGKANIQDVTDPLHPISLDGNATLQLWMTDNGEPGSADTIGIQVLNKNGGTWFTSNWNGTNTVEQNLGGGNLSVK